MPRQAKSFVRRWMASELLLASYVESVESFFVTESVLRLVVGTSIAARRANGEWFLRNSGRMEISGV